MAEKVPERPVQGPREQTGVLGRILAMALVGLSLRKKGDLELQKCTPLWMCRHLGSQMALRDPISMPSPQIWNCRVVMKSRQLEL